MRGGTQAPAMPSLAKITAPRLARVHARERLFARVDAVRPASALWICGPPGSGKTTLAASYLQARGLSPLWCRLDAGDADPATFFHYLAAALGPARARGGRALPRFTPEHRDGLPSFARRFFREFFARVPGEHALVLDDYHELGDASAIDQAMLQALQERPADLSLLVISRKEPPASLARQRANGGLAVIDGGALRLDDADARAIALGRGVPPERLGMLVGRAQGWCAGLVLLCDLPAAAAAAAPPAAAGPPAPVLY
jgi:LuxR family maltose regulon positive regulatory protein